MIQQFDVAMAAMADALTESGDLDQSLGRITAAAVETIPGADLASISIRHRDGTLTTSAATDPLADQADLLQYELREGPCYDAVTDEYKTYSPDLAHDPEWPRFGPRVAELGLLSQRAIRIAADDSAATGLNLYSRTLNAFSDDQGLPDLFASCTDRRGWSSG